MVVFLSYAWESAAHGDRVRRLAERLERDRLSVRLDQLEADHAIDWPLWCECSIAEARWILPICSPTWLRRYLGQESPGVGRGVTWEARIIRTLVYNAAEPHERVLPVLLDDAPLDCVPPALAGQYWRLDEQYEALVQRMWRLGTPPWGDLGAGDLTALNDALVRALPSAAAERAFLDALGCASRPSRSPPVRWLAVLRELQDRLPSVLDAAWRSAVEREPLQAFIAPVRP